jgi:hypothetical protein
VPEDWQQEAFDTPEGEEERGVWQVHAALRPSEADAVARAAPLVVPAESFEIHTELAENGTEGEVLLALRVFAESKEDALARARHQVRKIRRNAGLPADDLNVLGFISPWWRRNSRAEHLAKEAHHLHEQGRHDLAVIRIQTATELRLSQVLMRRLGDHSPDVNPGHLLRRPVTLRDRPSRELFHLLTGRRIQEEPWWADYLTHVQRRHEIVHGGVQVDRDEAFSSLEVAIKLHAFLLDIDRASDAGDG